MAERNNMDLWDDYDPWEAYNQARAAAPAPVPVQSPAPELVKELVPEPEEAPKETPEEVPETVPVVTPVEVPEDKPEEEPTEKPEAPEEVSEGPEETSEEPKEKPEDAPVRRSQEKKPTEKPDKAEKVRRGKRRWRIFLLVYSVLFLAAGAVGCYVLYRYTGSYEASLPEHVMDELMAETTEDEWYEYVKDGADIPVSVFEDGDALFQSYYDAAVRGKPLSYWKDLEHYTDMAPVYKVRGGGLDLCLVYLAPKGQDAAGFGRQLWQIDKVESVFSLGRLESVAVEIDAPKDAEVCLNGVPMDSTYIAEEVPAADMTELESRFTQPPTYVRYRVGAMYGDIVVTDAQLRVLDPETEEDGLVRYVLHEPKDYSVTVRAPSTVTVAVNGAELAPDEAFGSEEGILAGLGDYTGGAGYQKLTYTVLDLRQPPEVTATGPDGQALTPLVNEKGEILFFPPQDDALAAEVEGRVQEFFNRYMDYSSQAFDYGRQNALLSCILQGTGLYSYVQNSRDAMIWASATQVSYDELTFADFARVGDNCFTCTIRYKADFAAQSWYQQYNYDMQNAYEVAFVRSGDNWYAAAMSVVAG